MRKLVLGLAACFAFAGLAKADVVLASNTAGTSTTGSGTLSNTSTGGSVSTTFNYTTAASGNSGGVSNINYSSATTSWNLAPSVGAFSPTTYNAFNIGELSGSASHTITSTQTLTDFYLIFNWTEGGTYDFSGISGTMTYLGGTATAFNNTSKTVTASTGNSQSDGFMLQFTNSSLSTSAVTFTTNGITATGASATLNIGVAVPEPGTLLLGGLASLVGGALWRKGAITIFPKAMPKPPYHPSIVKTPLPLRT